MSRIANPYAVEADSRDLSMDGRKLRRAGTSLPILTELHDWLQQTRLRSTSAKVIDYSLKRWVALSRYAKKDDLPTDNNPVENSIRPIALGKMNWLFAGSERTGQRAAVIQTVQTQRHLSSAQLKDTLENPRTRPNSCIGKLLPVHGLTIAAAG